MFTSDAKSQQFAGLMYGFAAVEGLFAVYLLTTEGPIESAFHSYQQSTGRAPAKQTWLRHVQAGFAADGVTARFSVTF